MNTTKQTKVIKTLSENKEFQKNLKKLTHYTMEHFVYDAEKYILAIKERRMLCNIKSVSSSGMSRVLAFHSCEKSSQKNQFWYRQYNCLFICLGYSEKNNGFNISGCGMDMIFATNYNVIHSFKRMGIINDKECSFLAQQTPVNF